MKSFSKNLFRLSGILFSVALLIAASGAWADTAQCLAQNRSARSRSAQSRSVQNRRIPLGTQMKVRLESEIDSKEAKNGDRFKATVLTPSQYADSTIEGHINRVEQSGKIKGRTTLALAFDSLRLPNGQTQTMRGDVVRVYGEKSAKEVDEEGKIQSSSRGASTAKRTAGGAAAGAILGGIIGGGKGAAIGAGIGAGAGAGTNVIRGSNQIKLERGTEILIKTR